MASNECILEYLIPKAVNILLPKIDKITVNSQQKMPKSF